MKKQSECFGAWPERFTLILKNRDCFPLRLYYLWFIICYFVCNFSVEVLCSVIIQDAYLSNTLRNERWNIHIYTADYTLFSFSEHALSKIRMRITDYHHRGEIWLCINWSDSNNWLRCLHRSDLTPTLSRGMSVSDDSECSLRNSDFWFHDVLYWGEIPYKPLWHAYRYIGWVLILRRITIYLRGSNKEHKRTHDRWESNGQSTRSTIALVIPGVKRSLAESAREITYKKSISERSSRTESEHPEYSIELILYSYHWAMYTNHPGFAISVILGGSNGFLYKTNWFGDHLASPIFLPGQRYDHLLI